MSHVVRVRRAVAYAYAKKASGGAVHAVLLRLLVCTGPCLPLQYSHHGARVVQGAYLLDGVATH